ncbi:MAG: esterase/lipase family protein [Mariniblastus sp.]
MESSKKQTTVIVIHGWGGHHLFMLPICWQLKRAGFQVKRFGYRSFLWSIETHAKRFEKFLRSIEDDPTIERFHIAAHSMGGIITRKAILDMTTAGQQPKKLDRIAMLGTPNHGSPVARYLSSKFPFRFCKTLQQLSDEDDGFIPNLAEPSDDLNIGIVAASYDFVVPERNSHLTQESDHIEIFSGHNGLLVRPAAGKRVVEFLADGRFKR